MDWVQEVSVLKVYKNTVKHTATDDRDTRNIEKQKEWCVRLSSKQKSVWLCEILWLNNVGKSIEGNIKGTWYVSCRSPIFIVCCLVGWWSPKCGILNFSIQIFELEHKLKFSILKTITIVFIKFFLLSAHSKMSSKLTWKRKKKLVMI